MIEIIAEERGQDSVVISSSSIPTLVWHNTLRLHIEVDIISHLAIRPPFFSTLLTYEVLGEIHRTYDTLRLGVPAHHHPWSHATSKTLFRIEKTKSTKVIS